MDDMFKYLLDYPIEKDPYPPGYPEDLMFDHYPGQDYVIGFCDEAITELSKARLKQKNTEIKELASGYIGLFKKVRDRRLKLLGKTTL